ncbi:RNA polymerase II C-terminal domain phosphatase-like 1 [Curcuma longa]|uniref:RNA polymerase II C-terminal domain phosphatase-like 1 n=1 Tax=Curcuma longa TaxID=136217 RepID=UPI003D9E080B
MVKSAVYYENSFLGEAEIIPQNSNTGSWIREIRISHLSPPSERCPPLAVLHTVASGGVCFKMESKLPLSNDSPLLSLHATLATENKTAVVPIGEAELHLVAMASKKNPMPMPYFWGFILPSGLYDSSLTMLNLRCLGIVFDLDETLLVANTMRSFEDRIDALQRKINNETDPQRIAGMVTEIQRYQEDKSILKQYAENDQVAENGKIYKVQAEMVPPLSDNHQLITRPVIRLQEKNIILTRVNPSIRDTSVLVRLRPAWEDLRSYLTAKGRKRFEVYVCTMAERDYALEMWRLLDPESNLISSSKLLDRIVCVKSGSRKSLLNVFHDGICHPKMALVIDDRLKVWDEKDQPRVHVVPAFAPYYAPQAETNITIPVLCVARNVACNVRGGFFKEFDEGILPRIGETSYEDEMRDFPAAPDVGNFLISEDDCSTLNINKDQLGFDGTADTEAERKLKEASCSLQVIQPVVTNFVPMPVSSIPHVIPSFGTTSLGAMQMMVPLPNNQVAQPVTAGRSVGPLTFPEASFQGSPAREEGEVPESELDPDTRRRLLILQHGQDTREPTTTFPLSPPLNVSIPPAHPQGNWFPLEEEINPRQQRRTAKEFSRDPDPARYRKRSRHPSFMQGGENSVPSDRVLPETRRFPMQLHNGGKRVRSNNSPSFNSFQGEEMLVGQNTSSHKDAQFEHRQATIEQAESPARVLQEIATKCGNKMEFRTTLCDTTELQFAIEVWFVGEKLGDAVGKTRKEALHRAAEISLRHLAEKYLSTSLTGPNIAQGDIYKFSESKENGVINDSGSFGFLSCPRNDVLLVESTSEDSRTMDQRSLGTQRPSSVTSLKELCVMEGFSLVFKDESLPSNGAVNKGEVSAQVEIAGQILGRGVGTTWHEAKIQAAEEALGMLKSMLGQFTRKLSSSPRSLSTVPQKRFRPEFSRSFQQLPSFGRYSKNGTSVP